ncbi:hypothetical protein ANCDUO_16597 [Ancylostoma duodenale]|uniref:Uncharacterized protein n=1 Tax=Ancylostoma duodenale TaxID=51022 RepID=A0A0C2G2Z8_9BILA|nr:hypothetical protein ANCDUO_16597 [Ancylostoma duodenale]
MLRILGHPSQREIAGCIADVSTKWWLWQRNWLLFAGGLLAVGVLVPIVYLMYSFAAATLLITEQHAEYGLEELPGRLNYCIDDLNLYKRNTDARIRKLLIDDYQMLNRTIAAQMSNAGHMMIQTVKKLTGAQSVDALINISEKLLNRQALLGDINEIRISVETKYPDVKMWVGNHVARSLANNTNQYLTCADP